jgi:drug/metabolite transporter (DMT)-like permease
MQLWQILAMTAPAFFVAYQALAKLLPKDTSVFLVNAYASLIGALIMIGLHFLLSSNKSVDIGWRTVLLALGMGALISIGNFLIIKAFTAGAPQSIFTSIFNPLYVLYAVAVGLLIWHEKLNLPQAGGIALSILGIILVAYFRK